MGRAESARRERPSRRLGFRPRLEAGPDACSSASFAGRPAHGLRRALACLLLAVAALLAVPGGASAQENSVRLTWPLVPSGLSDGDRFRLIFITDTARDATSTDIDDYNAFVQSRAAAGHTAIQPYSDQFRVVGSTAAVDARDNTGTTGTGVPIYWLNGSKVADNYADFYDGSWDDEENPRQPSGTRYAGISLSYHTGSDDDGTERFVSGSSRALGKAEVSIGRLDHATRNPLSGSTILGANGLRFYGLSPVFTVRAQPTIVDVSVTSSPADGTNTFKRGERIEVTATFNEAVEVRNPGADGVNLYIPIETNVGSTNYGWLANYLRMAHPRKVVFGMRVASNHADADGLVVGSRLPAQAIVAVGNAAIVAAEDGVDALLSFDDVQTQLRIDGGTGGLTGGVCDRHPAVRAAIVAAVSGASTCAEVTDAQLAAIGSLDLSGDGIDSLHRGDLAGLDSLTELDLSDNALDYLPGDLFEDVTTLDTLLLHDNDIATLTANVFDGLTVLRILDLQRNGLRELPAGVFDDLAEMGNLRLSNNALSALPDSVFEPLTKLWKSGLWLSRNPRLEDAAPRITVVSAPVQDVSEGAVVELEVIAGKSPWGSNLSWSWTQVIDEHNPAVTLENADTRKARFTTPNVGSNSVYRFKVTATGRGTEDHTPPRQTESPGFTVTVAPNTSPANVRIEAPHPSIGGGLEDLVFRLTRDGETQHPRYVTVSIEQDRDWLIDDDRSQTVLFAADETTATLTVPASRFSFTPAAPGNLTATVSGTGITGGSATVEIVSTPGAPVSVGFDRSEFTFAEDSPAASTAIGLVATLDPAYPRAPTRDLDFTVSTESGTATYDEDYVGFSVFVSVPSDDFRPGDDGLTAGASVEFRLLDDDVYEGSETLVVKIERSASLLPEVVRFVKPDGTTGGRYDVTVTDEEDAPALVLSAEPASIAEEDDDATMDVFENVSTLTVEIGNGKTYAADRTVTLTFSGTATKDTDYSVSPEDADGVEPGHQVALPAGDSAVSATVTAAGNSTADGNRSIAVRGAHDGTDFGGTTVTILDDETMATNNPATGTPTISGVPQAGRMLEVDVSDIMDDNGLPATFDYRWVRVDTASAETTVGSNSTYTVSSADVGSTVRVEVSFTDGANNREQGLASEAVGPVVAAPGACPAGSDWSALMTLGYSPSESSSVLTETFGYSRLVNFGALDRFRISYNDGTNSPYSVSAILRERRTQIGAGTVDSDTLTLIVSAGGLVDDELPHGTLLNVGGTVLEVDADSGVMQAGDEVEKWDLAPLGLSAWVEGQEMRVCADLPPRLVGAALDGTSLVLEYHEALDRGSVPAPGAYSVKVNGTPATVSGVEVDGGKVTLTLAAAVTVSDTVLVSYAPGSSPLRGRSEIDAPSFTDFPVDNTSSAPVPASAEVAMLGSSVSLAFNEDLDNGPDKLPPTSAFTVKADGVELTVEVFNPGVLPDRFVLELPAGVFIGRNQIVTVSYAVPATNPLQDADGNQTAAFDDFPVTNNSTVANTTPTVPASAEVLAQGNLLQLNFNEDLDIGPSKLPPVSAFTVKADGIEVTLQSVNLGLGLDYFLLRLANGVFFGRNQIVTVSYAVPATNPLQDADGNQTAAFDDFPVTNNSTVANTTPPVPASAEVLAQGNVLQLNFNEDLDIGPSKLPPVSAFTVKADGIEVTLQSANLGLGLDYFLLTLANGVFIGRNQIVTVSYAVPATNPLQDADGNKTAAFTDFPVTNNSTVANTTSPVPASAEVRASGALLTLIFNEDLDIAADRLPPADAFTVKANGAEVAVESVLLDTGLDRLHLDLPDAAIDRSRTVTVSYAVPATNPVRDADGNQTVAFTDFPVANNSTVARPNKVPEFAKAMLEFELAENEPVGTAIGAPVVATDADGDTLTYSLGDTPSASQFGIDVMTGQLLSASDSLFDFERLAQNPLEISVIADDGYGGTAEVAVTVTITDEEEPPLAPAAPRVAKVRGDETALRVTWEAPDNEGRPEIERYELQYRESGNATDPWQEHDEAPAESDTSATVGGLTQDTEYEVQVRAWNADGEGDWSPSGQGAPGVVTEVGGDLRLVDKDGNVVGTADADADGNVSGRLEVYHRGQWGTVCDDRFDRSFDFEGTTVVNHAPVLSCRLMGYETGTVIDPRADEFDFTFLRNVGPTHPDYVPIWLDDVRCVEGEMRDPRPVVEGREPPLHRQCWHAGVGLENCGHREDIHLVCSGLLAGSDTEMQVAGEALTLTFEDVPESHDGSTSFTIRLAFGDDVDIDAAEMKDHALLVSNATVSGAAKVDDRSDLWELTVQPTANGGVGIIVPQGRACTDEGALCTEDGRTFSDIVPGIQIPYAPSTEQQGARLTAAFENVPEEHDGETVFTFELAFSEAVFDGTESFDKNDRVQNALQVDGAQIRGRRRADPAAFDRWIFEIRPSGNGGVTVTLPATEGECGDSGAICTPDDVPLAAAATATIPGPPGLSVADAEVEEGAGATLAFAVTLSRASSTDVSVDYATVNGSAEAGKDYEATSGVLRFQPGDTEKTVSVPILDDSEDEGDETLTLILTDPTGGNAFLADDTATGTIRNSDLMPQAWLARFGRTVAEQVLDAVEGRLRSAPPAGTQVTVAGRRLGGEAPDAEALEEAEAKARLESVSAWLAGETEAREGRTRSREVAPRELLTGSSFALTAKADGLGGGLVSLWGRGAVSRFDGREDELSLSGEVTGALLGADWTRERWTAGLMLSHARGEGGYRGASGGEVSSTVTGLYPYGRYALSERVTLWGTAGYGSGELVLTPDGGAAFETDMDLAMAAAGLRGVVVEAPEEGGPELAVKTDALGVRTSSEAVAGSAGAGGNLAAAQGDVARLRLGLEGTWRGLALGPGTFEPRLEVGVRHDGGDAETGFGLDLGGGLAWSDPGTGLRAEASGRGLLTHERAGFRQRGFAGSFGWDPAPGTDRGPSLTLTQTMGASARGGADALFGQRTLEGLAANDDGDELERRRLEVKLGYGFAAFGDRFTATPELGFGLSAGARDYRLGWRLTRAARFGGALELALEGRRLESANDDALPEDSLGLRISTRW